MKPSKSLLKFLLMHEISEIHENFIMAWQWNLKLFCLDRIENFKLFIEEIAVETAK